MLSAKPPYLMVDAVTLFTDHIDPEAFYYMVSVPELVRDAGEPAFWATAILPAVSVTSGGAAAQAEVARTTVSFDVQLGIPESAVEKIRKEIQKRWGRTAKRLVPVPLRSGKAHLTVARPGAGEATKDFFTYEGHPPSLVGDNRAAFALAAQGEEAQFLTAALSGGSVPAVVSYELEYLGLAPSFRATMVVHWSSVYKQLRERATKNFIFVSSELDKTMESMRENRAIEINVEELDPEGAKAATKALFDELKTQAVKKLFETPRPVGEVPIEERIGRGVRDVLTSLLPGVSHTLRQMDQRMLSDTTIDLREQQVKPYFYYPQSTLAGILARAGGVKDRLVTVRIDDLPNRVQEVVVEMAGGSTRVGVRNVNLQVRVTAPGRDVPILDQSVPFDAAKPERATLRFRRPGKDEPIIHYKAEMTLDPVTAPKGKERWSFDWVKAEGNRIWFNPEEFLDAVEARVELDDPAMFDLGVTCDMELEARLPGEANPVRSERLSFDKTNLSRSMYVILPEGAAPQFRGREIFRRKGEQDLIREVPNIPGPVHRIMNPFGQAWRMEVRAVADWTKNDALVVELRVWDVVQRTWLRDEHRYTESDLTYMLRFNTSAQTPRTAEARVTRIGKDGAIVRGPWKEIAGPVVGVTDQVQAVRRVRGKLSASKWKQLSVKKAWAELEYKNTAHVINEIGRMDFSGDGSTADWVHQFPDPSRATYRYRLRATGEGGERYNGPWTDSAADDLDLTLPPAAW